MGGSSAKGQTRRKNGGNIASRYLAAISACGDREDATLSPMKNRTATNSSAGDGFATDNTPKTPTRRDPRWPFFTSAPSSTMPMTPSPSQKEKAQLSPSLATAPTFENSSSSPTSRMSRGTHNRSSPPYSSPPQNGKQPIEFFSVFPSTKVARRGFADRNQQHAIAAAKRSPPPPPALPHPKKHSDEPSFALIRETPSETQHLQSKEDSIELVLGGPISAKQALPERSPQRLFHMLPETPENGSSSLTAGTSEVSSDLFSATGAPTEIITNRAADRRYVINPEEALWRKKKGYNRANEYIEEDVEEKKQDTPDKILLRKSENIILPNKEEIVPSPGDDMIFFAPVPLERINTPRISNRGKFNQYSRAGVCSTFPLHTQYQKPSQIRAQQREYQANQQCESQQTHEEAQPSPINQRSHHVSQTQAFQGSPRGQPSRFVRYKQTDEAPSDVKSLLSSSTNTDENSSALSPNSHTLLNPIANIHKNKPTGCSQPQQSKDHISQQCKNPAKEVVAYPEHLSYYLKADELTIPEQREHKAQHKPLHKSLSSHCAKTLRNAKKEESFASQDTEAGVIGHYETDENAADAKQTNNKDDGNNQNTPMTTAASAVILKPGSNSADPNSRRTISLEHLTSSTEDYRQKNAQKDVLEQNQFENHEARLQPRPARARSFTGQDSDLNRSLASESTAMTPMTMSESGLNFSESKTTPLLPLFSQDRFDFFCREQEAQHQMTTSVGNYHDSKTFQGHDRRAITAEQQHKIDNQDDDRKNDPEKPRTEDNADLNATFTVSGEQTAREGICPAASLEIWRRGDSNEGNTFTSPDPIFCTQPSASQPSAMTSSMISSSESFSPRHGIASPQASPIDSNPDDYGGKCHDEDNGNLKTPPRPRKPPGAIEHVTNATNTMQSQGLPRRAASGPIKDTSAQFDADEENACICDGTVSSRQVEIGVESVANSKSSLPKRSRSESHTVPKNGTFLAALAAFETDPSKHKRQPPFNPETPECANEIGSQGCKVKCKGTSRLSLVLGSHLARITNRDANENIFDLQAQPNSDSVSIDVQSIRSAFESTGNPVAGAEDDDDDTASVKSLREVYEAAGAGRCPRENGVSKMRAFFENKKPPAAKSFETGNSELRNAWCKFETSLPRPRRRLIKRGRDNKPVISESASLCTHTDQNDIHNTTYDLQTSCKVTDQEKKSLLDEEPDQRTPLETGTFKEKKENLITLEAEVRIQAGDGLTHHSQNLGAENYENVGRVTEKHRGVDYSIRHDNQVSHLMPMQKELATENENKGMPERGRGSTSEKMSLRSNDIHPQYIKDKNLDRETLQKTRKTQTQTRSRSSSSSEQILSPPRLGIQSNPRQGDGSPKAVIYPLKDSSPASRSSKRQSRYNADKQNGATSESEFSDGVTLDLSIAEVSQLTNPTAIQSKAGDDSTLDDVSAGEKTVVLDIHDNEAKRSEASSSQMTEAAVPLIQQALKRLSDDVSSESRNHKSKPWKKSASADPQTKTVDEERPTDHESADGWDLRHVESSFPLEDFNDSHDFFGFDSESKEEWQFFDDDNPWFLEEHERNQAVGESVTLSHAPQNLHSTSINRLSIARSEMDKLGPNNQAWSPLGSAAPSWSIHGKTSARNTAYNGDPKSPFKVPPGEYRQDQWDKNYAGSLDGPGSPSRNVYGTPTQRRGSLPSQYGKRTILLPYAEKWSPQPGPPMRSQSPSRPSTPTQRSVTPTMNNLRRGDISSEATPKVSYYAHSIGQNFDMPESTQRFNDAFAEQPKFNRNEYIAAAPRKDELKHDCFSTPTSPTKDAFYSRREYSKIGTPSGAAWNSSHSISLSQGYEFESSLKKVLRSESSPTRVQSPQGGGGGGLFRRTHPMHNPSPSSANIDSHLLNDAFRSQQEARSPTEQQLGGLQPSEKFAEVVGKHAALMARLKVLKASRARRSENELRSDEDKDLPNSTFGRAVKAVYSFGRTPSLGAANKRREVPAEGHRIVDRPRPTFTLPYHGSVAPDCEDGSVSTRSSTHYGGGAFAAMLEVE